MSSLNMIQRLVDAILNKESLQKYVLALHVISNRLVYHKNQMQLFESIHFHEIMTSIQNYRFDNKSLLILSMYDKEMFEFLLSHWTNFDGTEAIDMIKHKKYQYLDKVPLNMIINNKTPLDIYPDLRNHTKEYVLKAKTIQTVGSTEESKVNDFIKNNKFNYQILFILSDDLDIDMQKKYEYIRDASFLNSLLFVKNYSSVAFRLKAIHDSFIVSHFLSTLRQTISWSKETLEHYLKHQEKYKIFHMAKILQTMNKKIDQYPKQLEILKLSF